MKPKAPESIFDIQRDTLKDVIKEAFKEWLSEQVHDVQLSVGKKVLTLVFGAAIFLGLCLVVWAWAHGWFK